jgi:hypothetical protein
MLLKTAIRLLFFICLSLPLQLMAQHVPSDKSDYTKIIDILPPSPNSASLGKYGGINVGLSSGMVDINIPVYEYRSSNVTVPISLRYTNNGLKVDEIASRVGMSWALNAGGVVTRTVMGGVDETSNRILPPADFPQRTQNMIDFAEQLSNTENNDGEPDLFSFNFGGYTGQFILDNNLNPLLLTYSAVKIEKNFSSTAPWNFKITTPDGVQYLFGGSTATETMNKYQSGCGKGYPNFTPTAWYLIQIIHPNNDSVNFVYLPIGFHYQTGVNQTLNSSTYVAMKNRPSEVSQLDAPPATLNNLSCVSWLETRSVYLQEINSTAGGKVSFTYIDRVDISDKLLTRIDCYQPGVTTPYKFFTLKYVNTHSTAYGNTYSTTDTSLCNRPFLTNLIEGNPSATTTKTHNFLYNNLSGLPARLSFAQDSYGYFNGKSNSTLVPPPSIADWAQYLPAATADRRADATSATCGTLSQIQYPTGGTESITYEGNTYFAPLLIPAPTVTTKISGTGNGNRNLVTTSSNTFSVATTASATVKGHCDFNPGLGYTYDPIHHISNVTLRDLTTSTVKVSSGSLTDGQSYTGSVSLTPGHVYQLETMAGGEAVTGSGSITYKDGVDTYQQANQLGSSLRVSRVVTNDGSGSSPQIKRYFYYDSSTPTQSSAQTVYRPIYEKWLRTFTPPPANNQPGGRVYCAPIEYDFIRGSSYSQTNIYAYSSPINYSSVIESWGDNFEGGGVEHHFDLTPDIPGGMIMGDPIASQPLSSYGWKNAREVYSCTFKMNGTAQVPVKKVFTHYMEDPRIDTEIVSYLVNKKYSPNCPETPPSDIQFDAYDLGSYSHFREWVYVDSVKTWDYDDSGLKYVETVDKSFYGNPTHAMLTKSTTLSSDGKLNTLTLNYPQDLTLSGAEETARQALISQYNISPILFQHTTKDATDVATTKINYLVYPNGLVLPHIYNVQIGVNPAENRVVFNSYNTQSKLLSQSLIAGPENTFIWDYLNLYPIAKVINGAQADIAYTSFEADGTGNWTIASSQRDITTAFTGSKSYNLSNGSIIKSGLTTTKAYVVSYWTRSASSLTITGTITGYPLIGATINGWTYYEHQVTGQSTITVSGAGNIDELRLYPKGAQMTTYTYAPLIGTTGSVDTKNNPTYYEYDEFQRLINIKDKDGYIVKHFDYHYSGQ